MPAALDRLALHATRLAGVAMSGLGLWSAYQRPHQDLLWSAVMTLAGIGLIAVYVPILRIVAFVFLFFAGLLILGGLSPFAAPDVAAAVREQPGVELRRVLMVVSASALLVACAFCIDHARRMKCKQAERRRTEPELAPAPPSADVR